MVDHCPIPAKLPTGGGSGGGSNSLSSNDIKNAIPVTIMSQQEYKAEMAAFSRNGGSGGSGGVLRSTSSVGSGLSAYSSYPSYQATQAESQAKMEAFRTLVAARDKVNQEFKIKSEAEQAHLTQVGMKAAQLGSALFIERVINAKRKQAEHDIKVAEAQAYKAKQDFLMEQATNFKDATFLSPQTQVLLNNALDSIKAGQHTIDNLHPILEKVYQELEAAKLKEQQEKEAQDARDAEAKADTEKASNEAQKEPAREDGFEYSRREYSKEKLRMEVKDNLADFKVQKAKLADSYMENFVKGLMEEITIDTVGLYLVRCPNPYAKGLGIGVLAVKKIIDFNSMGDNKIQPIYDAMQLEIKEQDYLKTLSEEVKEWYPSLIQELYDE